MSPVERLRSTPAGLRAASVRTIAWKTHLLAIALLVFGLVAASRSAASTAGGTWDESVYLSLGRGLLLSDDWDRLAALGVAPLPVRLAWNRDALEPIGAPANDAIVYRERVSRARENVLWRTGVPLVLVVYGWIAAAHGLVAGFIVAALLALSPNILAHVSLATTDITFTLSFVVALVALVYGLRQQSFARSAILSAALGLSLASKYSALALFLSAVTLFVMYRRERRQWLDVAVLAGALIVAWAAHGWAVAPVFVEGGAATWWVDSNLDWGQDLPRLADWLHGRGTDRVLLSYFGTAPPAAYGIRATTLRAAISSEPEPEWFAISVTLLQGVFVCGDPFAGLRAIEAEARIGYTMMVYSLRNDTVRSVLAAARHDTCAQ